MASPEPGRLDRRAAIKWMLAATASAALLPRLSRAADAVPGATGYGADPDLAKTYHPGDLWPLTFTDAQRRTAAALCDFIIPADDQSPGAASLGVQDFIDEWISAPYPQNLADRKTILAGLAWLEAESQRRFGLAFSDTIHRQKAALGDDLCHEPDAKPEFQTAARFFKTFRDLTAGGFYTTPEGMKDLQYIGNVPLASFPETAPEVLKRLGLA
jgi:hypothetical protein